MKIGLTNLLEIELSLLTNAYFFGDFSIIYHFTNRNSPVYSGMMKNDLDALRKFADRNRINFDLFSEEDKKRYHQFEQMIVGEFKAELEKTMIPLPDRFLLKLAERAIELDNFSAAHSALAAINQLDKRVNQLIVNGVELLQSKEMRSDADDSGSEQLQQKLIHAVDCFYKAIRIKNPLGNQFQYLSQELHLKDVEALRKYSKHVELNLLKEIIDFCIQYLTDDKAIAAKITDHLQTGKLRKFFLRYFAMRFSLGAENYQNFVRRYFEAVTLFKNAKEERDFLDVQKTLLGRGTGNNEYYQFLRELAVEHPISTLLIMIAPTPDNVPILAPIILKSGISLMEFLELDK